MQFTLHFTAQSIKGRREYNQDNFIAKQLTSDVYLFAVADGMGGTFGGEKASEIAIDELEKCINQNLDIIYDESDGLTQALEKAVTSIQYRLEEHIADDDKYNGMGTTLTALLCCENHYAFCNIGDSRIYQFKKNHLKQLTDDHSYVQELIKRGDTDFPPEFLKKHENVITRVLNGGSDEADYFPNTELVDHTVFMLCSDGLILEKNKESYYLKDILNNREVNLDHTCNKLIEHAYENGSTDNITCILVLVQANKEEEATHEVKDKEIETKILQNPNQHE